VRRVAGGREPAYGAIPLKNYPQKGTSEKVKGGEICGKVKEGKVTIIGLSDIEGGLQCNWVSAGKTLGKGMDKNPAAYGMRTEF